MRSHLLSIFGVQYLFSVKIKFRDFTLCYGDIKAQLSEKKSLNLIEM